MLLAIVAFSFALKYWTGKGEMKYLLCPQCDLRNDVVESSCLRCGASLTEVIPVDQNTAPSSRPSQIPPKSSSNANAITGSATQSSSEPRPTFSSGFSSIVSNVQKESADFDPLKPYPYAHFFIANLEKYATWAYRIALFLHFVIYGILAIITLFGGVRALGGGLIGIVSVIFAVIILIAFCVIGFWVLRFSYYMAMALADFYHAFLQIEKNTRPSGQSSSPH